MSTPTKHTKSYIGDGVYIHDDGFMLWLTTRRENGEHYIALESEVIISLLRFIERSRNVKITVEVTIDPLSQRGFQ